MLCECVVYRYVFRSARTRIVRAYLRSACKLFVGRGGCFEYGVTAVNVFYVHPRIGLCRAAGYPVVLRVVFSHEQYCVENVERIRLRRRGLRLLFFSVGLDQAQFDKLGLYLVEFRSRCAQLKLGGNTVETVETFSRRVERVLCVSDRAFFLVVLLEVRRGVLRRRFRRIEFYRNSRSVVPIIYDYRRRAFLYLVNIRGYKLAFNAFALAVRTFGKPCERVGLAFFARIVCRLDRGFQGLGL